MVSDQQHCWRETLTSLRAQLHTVRICEIGRLVHKPVDLDMNYECEKNCAKSLARFANALRFVILEHYSVWFHHVSLCITTYALLQCLNTHQTFRIPVSVRNILFCQQKLAVSCGLRSYNVRPPNDIIKLVYHYNFNFTMVYGNFKKLVTFHYGLWHL